MSKTTKNGPVVRESESHVANQIIDAVQNALAPMDLLPLMDESTRRSTAIALARTPDAFCEAICSLADRNGGTVLGVAVDTASVRQSIAHGAAFDRVPAMLRASAQRIEDDIAQRRMDSVDMVRVAYGTLAAAQRTAAGQALRPEYLEIRGLVRRAQKRTPKVKPGAQSSATSSTTAATSTGSTGSSNPAASPAGQTAT